MALSKIVNFIHRPKFWLKIDLRQFLWGIVLSVSKSVITIVLRCHFEEFKTEISCTYGSNGMFISVSSIGKPD